MSAPLDWTTDPIVVLEKLIDPVLAIAPEALCALALHQHSASTSAQLDQIREEVEMTFRKAETNLANGGAAYLAAAGVHLDGAELAHCHKAAKTLSAFCTELTELLDARCTDTGRLSNCATTIRTLVRPQICAALDAMRATFIDHVMTQYSTTATRAEVAIQQLSVVSKKIFYISLNASVEAARVGDAGRGFAFISQEIRALSQDAQEATANLAFAIDRAN